MTYPVDSALRGAEQPYDVRTATRTLDLTTGDGSLTLVEAGTYEIMHDGAGFVACVIGATTVGFPPATTVAEAAGFMVPPGGVVAVVLEAGAVLHARTLAGTAALYVVRKVLA